jgi:hypothetical protein
MKEFEKLILGNLQETVIAPALMRVASVSVAHPNAVRAAVPNIARTIQRSNFVRTGSQQANELNHTVTNQINSTGNNIGNNHINNITTNNRSVSQNSTNADIANGNQRTLPNRILQAQNRRNTLNAIKQKLTNGFKPTINKTVGTTKMIGQSALSAVVNQLQ